MGIGGRKGDLRVTLRVADGTATNWSQSHLLLAAGRTANVENLGLDVAGVAVDHGRIVANAGLRTTNPNIYVIGDAAGGYQFTHLAEHHAGVVLRQALFRMWWAKPSPVGALVHLTDPELARVGLSETEAQRGRYRTPRVPVCVRGERPCAGRERDRGSRQDRHRPPGPAAGRGDRGPHAGELIAEYVLALTKGMNATDVTGMIHTYPTLAQINRRVADQRLKEGLTPSSKRWIRRIFGLRGARPECGGASGKRGGTSMTADRTQPQASAVWRRRSRPPPSCHRHRRLLRAGRAALPRPRGHQGEPRRAARLCRPHLAPALAIAFVVYVGVVASASPGAS